MAPKLKAFLAAFAISFPLDQLTKTWVATSIHYGDRIPVMDGFFYLTHVRNPGAAFSMFATAPEMIRRWFFVVVTLVAIVMIISFYRQLTPGDRLSAIALGLILGGASGNLFDRLFRNGEVVDFLHFRLWTGYSWPDFNVADSCIVIGVGLLVLELFASEGEQSGDPRGTDAERAGSGARN